MIFKIVRSTVIKKNYKMRKFHLLIKKKLRSIKILPLMNFCKNKKTP